MRSCGDSWKPEHETLLDLGYEVVEWAPLLSLVPLAEKLSAVTRQTEKMLAVVRDEQASNSVMAPDLEKMKDE